jgi:hypothetical protein
MVRIVMRRLVSNLTATMLLVHSLVGCCGRLDVCHKSCERSECCDAAVAACCHDDHATESHQDKMPIAPCDCKLHCKALCVSLPPEKAAVDIAHSARAIDVVAVVWTAPAIHASAAAAFRGAVGACRSLEPPLRLHLLHQIMLI